MLFRRCADYTVARAGAAVLALMSLTVQAQPESYQIDATRARVEYAVTQLGFIEQRGRFGAVRGSLRVDPEAKALEIELAIDARSVDVGGVLDAFARGESLLDTTHYPEIRFRSTHVEWDAERPIRVEGALTLHGVTRPIALALTSFRCEGEGNETCRATATGTLERSLFGMSAYTPVVSDTVTLEFDLTAVRRR
jgi:polyisoprenoid-binding protein YceI